MLHPPDRWEARFVEGAGKGSVYEYRLLPRGQGCRLEVAYNIRARRLGSRLRVLLARRMIRRELDAMEDGFARAMEEELAQGAGGSKTV